LTILNAVNQYYVDETNFPGGPYATCPAVSDIGSGGIDLANPTTGLVDTYIADIPQDPSIGTDADIGYDICQTSGDRITVSAPESLNDGESSSISATR
jgi:hypothetical protein